MCPASDLDMTVFDWREDAAGPESAKTCDKYWFICVYSYSKGWVCVSLSRSGTKLTSVGPYSIGLRPIKACPSLSNKIIWMARPASCKVYASTLGTYAKAQTHLRAMIFRSLDLWPKLKTSSSRIPRRRDSTCEQHSNNLGANICYFTEYNATVLSICKFLGYRHVKLNSTSMYRHINP